MNSTKQPKITNNNYKNDKIFRNLNKEYANNFYYYISMLNLQNDEPLILSPVHHYYYDFNELKNNKTIIQIKELNRISDINKFFNNISQVLSPTSNFIGCFRDNKIYRDNIFKKIKIIDWIMNRISSNSNHYLSRKKVLNLLNKYNFKIIDITEFDNITYFYIKK